jgi:hypothetical protein
LRSTFAPESLERFGILQVCPYFADEPLEIAGDSQLGPPGRPAAVPAEIRRAGGAGQPGKVGRMTRDSPATVLGTWLGSGLRRRWGSAAWPGGGRRELCSSEGRGNVAQLATEVARVGASGGFETPGGRWRRPQAGFRGGGGQGGLAAEPGTVCGVLVQGEHSGLK